MKVQVIPTLQDNLSYVIYGECGPDGTRPAAVVDPGEAGPVQDFLISMGLTLNTILLTHHHLDHIAGTPALLKAWPAAEVLCSKTDQGRIDFASRGLSDSERFQVWADSPDLTCLHIPGHTQGQIAIHEPQRGLLWVGDTLFRLGCGRLLEGSAEQLFASLNRLARLPAKTLVFVGHEYTEKNAAFSAAVDPSHSQVYLQIADLIREEVKRNGFSEPLLLEAERSTNLFLRASSLEEFAKLRAKRDQFVV